MSKNYRIVALATALLSAGLSPGLSSPVLASGGTSSKRVDTTHNDNSAEALVTDKTNGQSVRFSQISPSVRALTIVAESARVVVKRVAGLSEITLSSSCPRNWSVQQGTVRQAGFSGEIRKGSALLADDLGSRAIVNGHVYLFPQGGMKGLKLGADGVFVDGQLVEPLKGSDIPCNCSGEDFLEVSVPQSFSGDLKIGAAGKSNLVIDSWKDGAVECVMLGASTLKAGKLESLTKAVVDNRGSGSADISQIDARVFVANIKGAGSGSIHVLKGTADMSNATVEGNGNIELHGKFKNLQQLVEGAGKIEVKP